MKFYDLLRTAWYSIRAYKFRIFLTIIGIIIGIASVSAILAIGEGVKKEATSSIDDSGFNKIIIEYFPDYDSEDATIKAFEKTDIDEIKRISGVKDVEENDQEEFFSFGDYEEISYFDKFTSGEFKTYDESHAGRKAFIGRNISEVEGRSDRRIIFLSYEAAVDLFKELEKAIREVEQGEANIQNISVILEPGVDTEEVINNVKDKLYELHPDVKGEYEEFNFQEIVESMQQIIGNITLFVAFAAGISLLVGGIGIMNIMYVSVTERKREIGIRRAIGAKPRTIMIQFLIEAIFITVIGGLIGVILGYLIASIAGQFMPITPVMTVSNFLAASSISVITGLVFGIIPASKATKLDPIEAIYE